MPKRLDGHVPHRHSYHRQECDRNLAHWWWNPDCILARWQGEPRLHFGAQFPRWHPFCTLGATHLGTQS
ncbi:MAG: hypothetical protein AAFV85_28245, partial [Cyanobacteria bacterium J06634_6]